jgi:CBS domain-containing protein
MRARDVADEYPVIDLDADAVEAVRAMVEQRLPGIVVTDERGIPHSVLAASEVLRLMVPSYVQDDPPLAHVYDEEHADRVAARLSGHSVRELLPQPLPQLSIVDPDATVIELAELMIRLHCPIVAVLEGDRMQGVVTTTHLLELILPDT